MMILMIVAGLARTDRGGSELGGRVVGASEIKQPANAVRAWLAV